MAFWVFDNSILVFCHDNVLHVHLNVFSVAHLESVLSLGSLVLFMGKGIQRTLFGYTSCIL